MNAGVDDVEMSAHAITADVDIVETAKAAEYFLSDGVIVTGITTGSPADVEELYSVKKAVTIPVLIGIMLSVSTTHTIQRMAKSLNENNS
jgi:hypothetical protein